MGQRWDAVTFGRVRRARRMMRRLRELDRADARARAAGRDPYDEWLRSRHPRQRERAAGAGRNPTVGSRRVRRVVVAVTALAASIAAATYVQRHGDDPLAQAQSRFPSAGHEERSRPLGVPLAAPPGSGGFAFEARQPSGASPVTWDPCRPIHFVTSGTAPAGVHSLLTSALARVGEVTGFRFVDDGPTSEVPITGRPAFQPDRYGDRWAPVLIAWTTPQQIQALAGQTIGLGGGTSVTDSHGVRTYVSGIIYLDAPQFARDLAAGASSGSRAILRAVILHEAGHLLGLAHVTDPAQVMYPESTIQAVDYGPGDLRGLRALSGGSCAPDL